MKAGKVTLYLVWVAQLEWNSGSNGQIIKDKIYSGLTSELWVE